MHGRAKAQSRVARGISARRRRFSFVLVVVLLSALARPLAATSSPLPLGAILVDASRDGGVWWYPQAGPFDPDAPHQGKALADYLRGMGYTVDELGRSTTITPDLLARYQVVIRAGSFGSYSSDETAAYVSYVEGGGDLMLLSEYLRWGNRDELAAAFGLELDGISQGPNVVLSVASHPIVAGVSHIQYLAGSCVVSEPSGTIIGRFDQSTYCDLDADGVQDEGEMTAAPAAGIFTRGAGEVFYMTDTNAIESVPQPLVDNLFDYLLGSQPPPPDTTAPTVTIAAPTDGAAYIIGTTVTASYSCSDEAGGSGLASCVGDTTEGASLDTATVGAKTFTVIATDQAGNRSSITHSYRVVYPFEGFNQPIDGLPALNRSRPGSSIAVKWGLRANHGPQVVAAGYPRSQTIACGSTELLETGEPTATAGSSGLTYDPVVEQYSYVWKTSKSWLGTCRQFILKLDDGTVHRANFVFGLV